MNEFNPFKIKIIVGRCKNIASDEDQSRTACYGQQIVSEG